MKMKVMLLTDLRKLGAKGDIIEVAPAYARNVLIRQWQAKEADINTIKAYEQKIKKKEKKEEEDNKKITEIVSNLKWNTLKISRTAAPMWNLYDKVTSQTLQSEIVNKYGYKFDLKNIICDKLDKIWKFDFELILEWKKLKFKGEVVSE